MPIEERIKLYFSENYNMIIFSILVLAFILRLYYFNINQAVWWDEAEYLTRAKYYAGILNTGEDMWSPRRPFLLVMLWALIYKLGGTEIFIKITELIFSIFGVYFTYLVGNEMFNKKTGLLAAAGMTVVNLHLFLTARMLVDMPAVTISTLAIYTFYKYYIKQQTSKYLWLTGLLIAIAGFIRSSTVLIIIPIGIIILINERMSLFKNKDIWKMVIIAFISITPYLLYLVNRYQTFNIFKQLTGIGEGRFLNLGTAITNIVHLKEYILLIPYELKIIFLILFLIGSLIFINLILGFDILLKYKEKNLQRELFLLTWTIIYIIFFGLFSPSYIESRYILYSFPAFFIIAGQGLEKIKDLFKNINKPILIIIITLILSITMFTHISFGDELIKYKAYSFYPLRPIGEWVKEHSDQNEVIISNSNQMEIMYYAERKTLGATGSEEEIIKAIDKYRPKYIIVSTLFFGNPVWHYQYPQKYTEFLIPVYATYYDQQQTKVAAIIYEVDYNNFNLKNALKKVNPEWTSYD